MFLKFWIGTFYLAKLNGILYTKKKVENLKGNNVDAVIKKTLKQNFLPFKLFGCTRSPRLKG